MNAKKTIALLCLAVVLLAADSASAAPKAAWRISATSLPTNFPAGAKGTSFGGPEYLLLATNLGAASAAGPITLKDTLPPSLTPVSLPSDCVFVAPDVTCTFVGPVSPGKSVEAKFPVEVDALAGPSLLNKASVESPGTLPASIETTTVVSSASVPFGFLPGFAVPLSEGDGGPATLAGSHPYQLTAELGFPTEKPLNALGGAGHLREITIDFPPGELINPAATPVLCTEAQLSGEIPGCPEASQVGTIDIITVGAIPEASPSALYNMVPPAGTAAELGFDALGVGVFVHLDGSVRSDGDYGISGSARDTLALTSHPVFGARVQLWGDPSGKSHDEIRGACREAPGNCQVPKGETALLTMPTYCAGQPQVTSARADSWEAPGVFDEASYQSASLSGAPATVSGCNELDFEPSIEAKPTTASIDSPSGLDFHLRQTQDTKLGGRSTAALRDATVTLPEGLVVNPSSGDGLVACSSAQIGLTTPVGQSQAHFSKAQPDCPPAAKIGTMEVTTPLLAQIDPVSGVVQRDPEQNPIPRPVPGSVYLAKPFDNPFGSLLAIYLAVEDPQSGTIAKLAGRVNADPNTGRLSTQVSENPQLPLSDVHLHLFEGARAPLSTPSICATHTTTAQLVPWSFPQISSVGADDAFATTAAPHGGACPTSPGAAPNKPSFVTGTLAPKAGAYSPLVMKLSREDGSQPIGGFETILPPGLSARLAGVPYCSEGAIAQAIARSKPNEGVLEQIDPSCPATSKLGAVDVAAGSGPTPLHTPGNVYLSGPYKGAPLSAVVITPAIAGPFDLGAVVVRAAIYLNAVTAQARAVSDPLPTILDGIPLDVRSVALRLNRSQFTINPTSCDPMTALATTISVFNQPAALSSPFQVGGCKSLPYKPKLTTRLFGPIHRGGHPRFRAVFTAKPGEANSKRIVLALPRSEFIDQAHFRTICTRVQFAAKQCPAGSVYGHVKALSPLVDYPLEGPVYLRSSVHKLPDIVLVLRGPPSQPIEVEAVGRVDSVNGGIRTTIESAPDAPVTKVIVTLQGAKKGLFQNSTNICQGTHRATLKLIGQNGKAYETRPLLNADCPKHKTKGKGR